MYSDSVYQKMFKRRSLICYIVIMLMFFGSILRVAVISNTDYTEVYKSQNCIKLKISNQRGTVFDRNMIPLTNNRKKIIAAVSPTPRAVTAISTVLNAEQMKSLTERLKSSKPVICEVPEKIVCDGIVCLDVYETDKSSLPAIHTIGYTDSDGKGVSGIEKAYDDILFCEDAATVYYECNAKGTVLEGVSPRVEYDSSISANGVITTIDYRLQIIVEELANQIETGAIVVADAKNGKIRAIASVPTFSANDIHNYLNLPDSPLLNRTINCYNVGSAFKPCVAIAGMNNNKSNFVYNCTGSCEIIDRFFKCHKRDGHGLMNLKTGLANSCNTYFYNFAFNIGGDEILKVASELKFGNSLKLSENYYTVKGNLPNPETLKNIANLANFSIGQGELLLSPISILTLYSAIANKGVYYTPSLVEGTVKDGKIDKYNIGNPTRVTDEKTADILKEYLVSVLTDGTGSEALSDTVTTAGKTATAQTGKFENGIEICCGWFCGFFPVENPEYVVTVFSENTARQNISCAKIFSQIADKITQQKNGL